MNTFEQQIWAAVFAAVLVADGTAAQAASKATQTILTLRNHVGGSVFGTDEKSIVDAVQGLIRG